MSSYPTDTVRVACVQMAPPARGTKKDRVEHAISLIDQLPPVNLIVLPELWPVGFFRLLTLEFGIALNWAYPAYMAFLVLSIFGRGANEDPYECRVRYEHCQRGGRASAVESADVAGHDRAVCSASSPVQSLSEQVGTQVAQILQPSHREADPNPHSIPYGPERA